MSRVGYSRRAVIEIAEIVSYLVEHSPPAAWRFVLALARAEQQLAEFPDSGALAAVIGTRRLVLGNYIVSYRRRGDDIEIFAVRHARRRDTRPG